MERMVEGVKFETVTEIVDGRKVCYPIVADETSSPADVFAEDAPLPDEVLDMIAWLWRDEEGR
jgi:hypothetical protein